MQPSDFLNLAYKFINSTDEAERRTAISRAYYYVYHYIKTNLVDSDINLAHDVMIRCFEEARIENQKMDEFEELGEALSNLKTDRVFADYKLHKSLNQKTCDTMIKRCLSAIEDFERCKLLGIIEAAKNYLKRFNYI
jgi:uncharacterized protein (UPF0332 family)